MAEESFSVGGMLLLPSLITLAPKIPQLEGVPNHWFEARSKRSAAEFGGIIRIVRRGLIFVVCLATKLLKRKEVLDHFTMAISLNLTAIILCLAGSAALSLGERSWNLTTQTRIALLSTISLYLSRIAWPAIWRVMPVSVVAATTPMILVVHIAIRKNWNMQAFEAALPGKRYSGITGKCISIGLLRKFSFGQALTVILCALFGAVTTPFVKSLASAPQHAAL